VLIDLQQACGPMHAERPDSKHTTSCVLDDLTANLRPYVC
jgi:hypothetical protein